jgi:2,3-bisphosphoglycerate-dependent phosphoglycerate mutase
MELYIIRHGQSANNATMLRNPHDRGEYDPALTDLGWKQAHAVADYLANSTNIDNWIEQPPETRKVMLGFGITKLYCSPMRRALQTCQPIGEVLGLQPEVWVDIHEHGGVYLEDDGKIVGYTGLTRAEMRAAFPNYFLPESVTEKGWWKPENGSEDLVGCIARAIRVADALRLQAASGPRIALVTHGTFASYLLKTLFNLLPGKGLGFFHYNTAISRVDLTAEGHTFLRFQNRVAHLTPELMS